MAKKRLSEIVAQSSRIPTRGSDGNPDNDAPLRRKRKPWRKPGPNTGYNEWHQYPKGRSPYTRT